MVTLVSRLIVSALALFCAAYFVPGVHLNGLYAAIIAALVLGLLNAIVRPILVILTLPVTILTLGLFVFVINAFIFIFAASFLEGFSVDGFVPALLGSVIVSVVSSLGNRFIKTA